MKDKEHLCSIMRVEQKNVSRVLEKCKFCSEERKCKQNLNSYSQAAALNLQTHPYGSNEELFKIHSPVGVFLQHLVDTDTEGFVIVAFMDKIFVYPKLGGSDCLALWDTWQVETKFSVMPSHWQELFVVLHCNETEKNGSVREKTKTKTKGSNRRCRYTQTILWCESGSCRRLVESFVALGLTVPWFWKVHDSLKDPAKKQIPVLKVPVFSTC